MGRKEAWKTLAMGVVRLNVSSEIVGKGKGTGVGIVAWNHRVENYYRLG